jgi:hypothetical protein
VLETACTCCSSLPEVCVACSMLAGVLTSLWPSLPLLLLLLLLLLHAAVLGDSCSTSHRLHPAAWPQYWPPGPKGFPEPTWYSFLLGGMRR